MYEEVKSAQYENVVSFNHILSLCACDNKNSNVAYIRKTYKVLCTDNELNENDVSVEKQSQEYNNFLFKLSYYNIMLHSVRYSTNI